MIHYNQWEKFRNYINETPIGTLLSRQDMLKNVYDGPTNIALYSTMSTMDSYRLTLTRIGILENVKRGVYQVKHHIKTDIPFQKIKDRAYGPPDWRDWFIKIEDKQKGLIK